MSLIKIYLWSQAISRMWYQELRRFYFKQVMSKPMLIEMCIFSKNAILGYILSCTWTRTLIMTTNLILLNSMERNLKRDFTMTGMEEIHHLLGMDVII